MTSSLSPANKRTVHLPALAALTISATGAATVVRLNDNPGGGDPYSPIALAAGDSKIIGPFSGPTTHRLECATGVLSWDIAACDFPSVASDVDRISVMTQTDYDGLATKDATTLYLVTDS